MPDKRKSTPSPRKKSDHIPPNKERLQKVLAHAGVASRRASEELIVAGRVTVNGRVVTELGCKVDPRHDSIMVNGQAIAKQQEQPVYVMLNKPRQVLSAASDDRGRRTVIDLVKLEERVYPVGRLDFNSEGLILLTNDGNLTRQITHPSQHVEKEYHVLVRGKPTTDTLIRWRTGDFELEGGKPAPATVDKLSDEGEDTWLRIILTEGRKRQVRESARRLGHPVRALNRVRIGPLKLGNLKSGRWRHLSAEEVRRLKNTVKKAKSKSAKKPRGKA
jgi:23S rRNA pseudouridine2605 synthase